MLFWSRSTCLCKGRCHICICPVTGVIISINQEYLQCKVRFQAMAKGLHLLDPQLVMMRYRMTSMNLSISKLNPEMRFPMTRLDLNEEDKIIKYTKVPVYNTPINRPTTALSATSVDVPYIGKGHCNVIWKRFLLACIIHAMPVPALKKWQFWKTSKCLHPFLIQLGLLNYSELEHKCIK